MDKDLAEIANNAIEELEAKDAQEAEQAEEQAPEAEETQGEDLEEGAPEQQEEEAPADEEEVDGEQPQEQHELSDEEFEEMARKRGYAKAKEEEDQQEEQDMRSFFERPKEIDEETWANTPRESQVLYNALPYIETVDANGDKIRIKTPSQLPANFEFADKATEKKFDNDMVAQEMRLSRMENDLRASQEQAQRQYIASKTIQEVAELQKAGKIATPVAKPGTREFDTDPAVITINKVIGLRNQYAEQGANISMEDALAIYQFHHPEEIKSKTESKADGERLKIARRVAGNSKSTGTAVNRAQQDSAPRYYKPGLGLQDVVDMALADMD